MPPVLTEIVVDVPSTHGGSWKQIVSQGSSVPFVKVIDVIGIEGGFITHPGGGVIPGGPSTQDGSGGLKLKVTDPVEPLCVPLVTQTTLFGHARM